MTSRTAHLFGKISMCVIYVWFGVLKLLDLSPATPLVKALQQQTLPHISFHQFIIGFAIFEIVIGLLFLLYPRFKLLLIVFFFAHIVMTTLPLFILPHQVW